MSIQLFDRQLDLVKLIGSHKFTLAYGSSRGGKSFALIFILFVRALMFPGSNHCVIRSTAASIPSTIWPTVMMVLKALAPGYREEIDVNNSNRCITLHNGSTVWFFGAQDEDAVEKIMGAEFATIFLNEVVNFDLPTYSRIITRLNANNVDENGSRIALKLFADCNPKAKSHWVYQMFCRKVKPGTEQALFNPEAFGTLAFDRTANPGVDSAYYDEMRNLSAEEQSRFLDGEWYDEAEGALFSKADLDDNRQLTPKLAEYDLTVVAVDPAITSGPDADETGIVVCGAIGEGEDRQYYPLADHSDRYHPHDFLREAIKLYHHYGCAKLVIEVNQGGDVWVANIRDLDPRVNVVTVRAGAGQGKNERAKPIGALMKAGRIHHPLTGSPDAEKFVELERQLLAMTGDYDRKRSKSPDRLDAYVYAISEMLTGHIVKPVVISRLGGWFR